MTIVSRESTASGKSFFIAKGQLNRLVFRPQIYNEHSQSSREIQSVVTSSNIVGQVFKASHDNINGIALTLDSAAGSPVDDFESYSNSTELQAVWVGSGTLATLDTVIFESGLKSMKMPGGSQNDEWVKTFASMDYTDFDFCFDWFQDHPYNNSKYEFFISDGTNTKRHQIVIDHELGWFTLVFNEKSFIEDGPATDMTNIIKMGIKVVDKRVSSNAYIDDIITTPSPGSVLVKLWDFGTEQPEDGVTSLDDATQYLELGDKGINSGQVFAEVPVFLTGGKRIYQVNNYIAGVAEEIPSNTQLIKNNHYGITIHYVDTDVNVWGTDTGFGIKNYKSGYAFSTPDTSTQITRLGLFSDLMFVVYSVQEATIINLFQRIITSFGSIASPGVNSTLSGHIEDKETKVTDTITNQVPVSPDILLDFIWRPKTIPKGGKFETLFNDDFTDDVFVVGLAIEYLYAKSVING